MVMPANQPRMADGSRSDRDALQSYLHHVLTRIVPSAAPPDRPALSGWLRAIHTARSIIWSHHWVSPVITPLDEAQVLLRLSVRGAIYHAPGRYLVRLCVPDEAAYNQAVARHLRRLLDWRRQDVGRFSEAV